MFMGKEKLTCQALSSKVCVSCMLLRPTTRQEAAVLMLL